jgi:AbrB family looped-hinge helix DNA binding protein
MRISTKGQVTIPVDVRERFGLLPNTEVEFVVDGGTLRLVVVERTRGESRGQRAVRALRGSATVSMSTDDILALTRGE